MKFDENLSSGSRVVPCGKTDGHDEANSSFLQCFERVYKRFEERSGCHPKANE